MGFARRVPIALLALIATALAGPAEDAYEGALALQKAGKWTRAQKAFRRLIADHPESELAGKARLRSDDNAFLGVTRLWHGGPSDRRIDVAVMGDGFTLREQDQIKQERWAKLVVDVLFREPTLGEYRNYFNLYFVRLGSKDSGVETRKKKDRYSTALDATAAGPHGQVMMDRRLVYRWLAVAAKEMPECADDRYVIAFARFGTLGMATGGVANLGSPDQRVAVHEFGHAFSRLLDEYTMNPGAPHPIWAKTIRAPNAATTDDRKQVPWAHMIRKLVKGIGVYEGGATYAKGVWRPARTCAMNVSGAPFCAVCREATLLVIHEYVRPIDDVTPATEREVKVEEGTERVLSVTPTQPLEHRLKVHWYLEPLAADAPGPEPPPVPVELEGDAEDTGDIAGDLSGRLRGEALPFAFHGPRSVGDRAEYSKPPAGARTKIGKFKKGRKETPPHHVFALGKLEPGRYRVTVQVRDETEWVFKDPKHLLEDRATWWVTVTAGK